MTLMLAPPVIRQTDQGVIFLAFASRLWKRQMPKILRLDQFDVSQAEQALKSFKAAHQEYADWQLLFIQTPHQSYSGEDPILVLNELQDVKPIGYYSMMIQAISD